MNAFLKDFETGWFGLNLDLTTADIDEMIRLLNLLRQDKIGHFHLSDNESGNTGKLNQIEVSRIDEADDNSNFIYG